MQTAAIQFVASTNTVLRLMKYMPYGAQLKFGIARQTAAGSGSGVTSAGSFHHIPC